MALISITDDSGQTHSIVTPAQQPAPDATAPLTSVPESNSSQPPAPEALASNAAQVVPPTGDASAAPAAAAPAVSPPAHPDTSLGKSGERTPEQAVSAAGLVAPPVIKDSTTTVHGRKAANVEKQIATKQAATDEYGKTLLEEGAKADERVQAGLDSQLATKQGQQTQLREDNMQYQADQRAADAEVKRLSDLPDGKEDPDRFVNSLSTGGKIGMAVLAMISGFSQGGSAALSHTATPQDNPVVDILKRRIDQDIASQRDELAQGRIRKNNLIARAMAKGATAQQAELTARGQLWGLANDIGTIQAQKLNLQGAQAEAAKAAFAAMQFQQTQAYADLHTQTENRIQSTHEVEAGKVLPHAGGEAQLKAWEIYQKAIDAGADPTKAYQQSGLYALGVAQPTGQTKEQTKEGIEAAKRSEDQGKVMALQTAADAVARSKGMLQDGDGNWKPGGLAATKAEQQAASRQLKSALEAAHYDTSAVDGDPGIGSKVLEALPFGFLLVKSDKDVLDDQATQLNALQSTLRPRLNPSDRQQPSGAIPYQVKGQVK